MQGQACPGNTGDPIELLIVIASGLEPLFPARAVGPSQGQSVLFINCQLTQTVKVTHY